MPAILTVGWLFCSPHPLRLGSFIVRHVSNTRHSFSNFKGDYRGTPNLEHIYILVRKLNH